MTSTTATSPPHRALVLGGGGSTGNAWLLGVLAGLADAGVDPTAADLVIGTSAGATTAAQVTATSPAALYAATVEVPAPSEAPGTSGQRRVAAAGAQMDRTAAVIAASADPADMRRRLGAAALALPASHDEETRERWRGVVASRLPATTWPVQGLLLTAVDAATGEPVAFTRDSGVGLDEAVAASCSSGFAFRIGDRRYLDGGYRANADNADLAAGCARVLVLSPYGGRARTPQEWGLHLVDQVAALEAAGSRVRVLSPAEDLTGARAMDLSLRPAAARSGYALGQAEAPALRDFWG